MPVAVHMKNLGLMNLTNRRRPLVIHLSTFALILIGGGCERGVPKLDLHALDEYPADRVSTKTEWRNARALPGGKRFGLDLGVVQPGSILRAGVLPSSGAVRATAYYAGRKVGLFTADNVMRWVDFRLELPTTATGPQPLVVHFDSKSEFHVSHVEVVGESGSAKRPNALVVMVDTLRRDHLGVYGYRRSTSPNIDAFATDAVIFDTLIPQSTWTRPSVASFMTSTYPNVHGAQRRTQPMRRDLPSLARSLSLAGYETHGFVTNPNLLPEWNFGGDFDRYVDIESTLDAQNRDDAHAIDSVIETFETARGRPWYFYVHAMSPHLPYDPPDPYNDRFASYSLSEWQDSTVNSGFEKMENGKPAGWTSSNVAGSSWETVLDERHGGKRAMVMRGVSAAPDSPWIHMFSGPVQARPGNTVDFGLWTRATGDPQAELVAFAQGYRDEKWVDLNGRIRVSQSPEWRYFQYHHDVVPEGVTQVRLAVYPKHERKGVAWYLDDFRIRVNSFESIGAAEQAYRTRQIDLYDGEIAYFDDQFKRLIEALKRLDQYENTCIVLISDHGEEFWEHGGTNHGHSLYDELLRVPCIVKLPGNEFAGARVSDVIEMVDIAPTILEVLNIDRDVRFQGRSASGLWLGGPPFEKRAAFAALLHEQRDMSTSRTSSAKFIWNIADGSEQRFDLLADPLEQSSLGTDSSRELVDALRVATVRDAAGLHILVPRDASTVLPLRSTIEGSFGERKVLVTPPGSAHVSQAGNVVSFDITAPQADAQNIFAPVHIVIDVGIETKFALRLDRNGEPLRQNRVGAGRDDRYPFAESGEVVLESLLARPTEIDLDRGSDKVRVWYLPDSAVIDLKEVDPDTAQALRALGYLK